MFPWRVPLFSGCSSSECGSLTVRGGGEQRVPPDSMLTCGAGASAMLIGDS